MFRRNLLTVGKTVNDSAGHVFFIYSFTISRVSSAASAVDHKWQLSSLAMSSGPRASPAAVYAPPLPYASNSQTNEFLRWRPFSSNGKDAGSHPEVSCRHSHHRQDEPHCAIHKRIRFYQFQGPITNPQLTHTFYNTAHSPSFMEEEADLCLRQMPHHHNVHVYQISFFCLIFL